MRLVRLTLSTVARSWPWEYQAARKNRYSYVVLSAVEYQKNFAFLLMETVFLAVKLTQNCCNHKLGPLQTYRA